MDDEGKLERARVVRLCIQLTGNLDAAEDLAQETLFEAWRNAHKLHDPAGRDRWLSAIARNVCLRWARSQGRERSRIVQLDDVDHPTDDFDVEVDLERHELAALLDRAMALLPPKTGQVLVERYILESPNTEIAARMGFSQDAVSMRLTRGKLRLRRVLTTDLRNEAKAYGFYNVSSDDWQQTRIWCPQCGRQRLLARLPPPPGIVSFRCPVCDANPEANHSDFRLANAYFARLIGHLTRPNRMLNRTAEWAHDYFRNGLAEGRVVCTHCGHPLALTLASEVARPDEVRLRRLRAVCDACGEQVSTSLEGLVLSLPRVRQFWREHRRMRALPTREVESEGQTGIVFTYESVSGRAGISVVAARDTFRVLAIHGTSDAGMI